MISVVSCGNPLNVANGMVINSTGTSFGETTTYNCNTGYSLSGSAKVTCLASGSWSSVPSCIGMLYFKNTYTYIFIYTYTYSQEYLNAVNLLNRFTATCDDLILSNGAVIYSLSTIPRLEGTVASFSCNTGYTLSSTTTRTCQSDRQWSESTPVCSCK